MQAEDIRKENLIHKIWNFNNSRPEKFPGGILVTGANSFIGAYIVSVLQDKYPGKIHLLLRAPSEKEAVTRMQQAFIQWGLGDFYPRNVSIHTGDVSMNRMGLQQEEFNQVKKDTGCVVHLAMTPLYHLPYDHFKRVWIPELERMIAFCGNPEFPKSLHYASSYNANFFQTDNDFKALNSNAWQSGYAGFKWVAGQAIQHAMDQNLQACIYDIPLVLGSEKSGICPSHYSIWLILDIFLKTGFFFPFKFRIIPVDILAEIMVLNILNEKKGNGAGLIRPMLGEPVTDRLFGMTVANILGLKEASLDQVRESCQNKLRFNFRMPENFYELMEKVNDLPAVFPHDFNTTYLPATPMVFMSNLNRIMSSKHETLNA